MIDLCPSSRKIAEYDRKAKKLHRALTEHIPLIAWHVDSGIDRLRIPFPLSRFGVRGSVVVNGEKIGNMTEQLVMIMDDRGTEFLAELIGGTTANGIAQFICRWEPGLEGERNNGPIR